MRHECLSAFVVMFVGSFEDIARDLVLRFICRHRGLHDLALLDILRRVSQKARTGIRKNGVLAGQG